MAQQRQSSNPPLHRPPPRALRRVGPGRTAGAVITALAVIGGFILWNSRQPKRFVVPADPPPIPVGTLSFPVRAEAERYRAALSEGQRRSLDVLEAALARAEAQDKPDRALIEQLRAQRNARRARLVELNGGAPR